MAKLANAKCPECGASMMIDPEAFVAKCSFCGTMSRVVGARTTSLPASDMEGYDDLPVIVLRDRSVYAWIAIGVVFVIVVVVGIVLTLARIGNVQGRTTDVSRWEDLRLPHAPGEHMIVQGRRRPFHYSISGDAVSDVVLWACFNCDGRGKNHLVAYDPVSLRRLWASEQICPASQFEQARAFAAADMILVAGADQLLNAYSPRNGDRLWSTATGGPVSRICRRDQSNLAVERPDGVALVVHAPSGQVTDEIPVDPSAACARLATDEEGPGPWIEKPAPLPGVIDGTKPEIDGLETRLSFLDRQTGWALALGMDTTDGKRAGTIAAFDPNSPGPRRGAHRIPLWMTPISDDPARSPGQDFAKVIAVSGGRILVPYLEVSGWRMSCRSLADGSLLWDRWVPLGNDAELRSLVVTETHVFAAVYNSMAILDLDDGESLAIIGG